jgi:hypothetical protein
MGDGKLTQTFYHMASRQTMPYSTSVFGLKLRIPLDVIRAVDDPLEQDSKLLDQARGGL